MKLAFLSVPTLALLSSAAHAQDRMPAQLMGSLILPMVKSDACRLPITPEERQRIAAAGQGLQQRLGMSHQAVDDVGRQIARDAVGIEALRWALPSPRWCGRRWPMRSGSGERQARSCRHQRRSDGQPIPSRSLRVHGPGLALQAAVEIWLGGAGRVAGGRLSACQAPYRPFAPSGSALCRRRPRPVRKPTEHPIGRTIAQQLQRPDGKLLRPQLWADEYDVKERSWQTLEPCRTRICASSHCSALTVPLTQWT